MGMVKVNCSLPLPSELVLNKSHNPSFLNQHKNYSDKMCNTFLGKKLLAILLVKLRIVKDFKKKILSYLCKNKYISAILSYNKRR
jgi:hypothetical protein